jgi:hypothetical protein
MEQSNDYKQRALVPLQNQSETDWVDTVVSCAQMVNKMFTRNTCRLCHVYSDKQVEFENSMRSVDESSSPVDRAFLKAVFPAAEVEMYRQFLFDEDSVVDSVGHREHSHDDEENQTVTTQRTH